MRQRKIGDGAVIKTGATPTQVEAKRDGDLAFVGIRTSVLAGLKTKKRWSKRSALRASYSGSSDAIQPSRG